MMVFTAPPWGQILVREGSMRPVWVACLMFGCGLATTCDMKKFTVRQTAPVLKIGARVLERFQDPEFARQAAPASLATIEGMLEVLPKNRILLEVLAKGLYEYTFAFLERTYVDLSEDNPEKAETYRRRARIHYLRVYELGLRMLRLDGVSITFQKTPVSVIRAKVKRLGKKAVPGLIWTGVGAGGAVKMGMDQPWLLGWVSKIPVLLRRAASLNPRYNHAMAFAALAMVHARDRMTGGSALRAKKHFERALKLTGRRFLMWVVLFAEMWAWQFQQVKYETVGSGPSARRVAVHPADKKALFVSLLDEVQRFPLARAPETRLANTLAKQWARRLRRKVDEFLK